MLFAILPEVIFASGNADVVISSAATANGSWAYSAPNYTFTPSANSAVIINTDIQNRLLGSGFPAGNVIILTACSGSGSQTGDVTTSTTITAAASAAKTLTITAAGSITISNAINLTGATGIGGGNIVLTGPSGVSCTAALTNSSGGQPCCGSNATGGAGGNITLTSSGGAVSVTAGLTAAGGQGGAGGSASGGTGGTITISGASVSIATAGTIATTGGAGPGAVGGAAGSISITATSTTISISRGLSSIGGTGGGSGSGNSGGNGGSITISSSSGTSISLTSTITSTGGAGGSSGNGGVGGAISITAGTTISRTGAISCSGGAAGTGGSQGNGGTVGLTGPSGLTMSAAITSSGASNGALTISDGNSTVTSGGENDGQTAGAYTVGNFVKTGTGNFKLAVSNAWTGTTTITAGTLTLGAANIIPTTQVIMNGGTLSAGYAETVGTLKVSASSVIDLVSSSHTLAFAASTGIAWTGGTTLTIKNWTGGYNGTAGTTEIMKTSTTTDLSAGQLAQIVFRNPTNGDLYSAAQLAASGQIVPTSTSLPVELISFNAEIINDEIKVLWATASEINSSYYDILRSADRINFESIHTSAAAGYSNSILNYYYVDKNPENGINYYKLVEYDFDGTTQESKIVAVKFSKSTNTISTYPNPTSNLCTLDFELHKDGIYYLKAINNIGQEVYSTVITGVSGNNKFTLSMQNFANGIYHFQLYNNTQSVASVNVVKE